MKIIKIAALWCPSCLIVNDIFNEINNVDVENLDYDFDELVVNSYNVGKVLPELIFLNRDGEELTRLIGEQPKEKIMEIIEKYRNE